MSLRVFHFVVFGFGIGALLLAAVIAQYFREMVASARGVKKIAAVPGAFLVVSALLISADTFLGLYHDIIGAGKLVMLRPGQSLYFEGTMPFSIVPGNRGMRVRGVSPTGISSPNGVDVAVEGVSGGRLINFMWFPRSEVSVSLRVSNEMRPGIYQVRVLFPGGDYPFRVKVGSRSCDWWPCASSTLALLI